MAEIARCGICGEPMPENEQMFKFHGFSGPCPVPRLPRTVAIMSPEHCEHEVFAAEVDVNRLTDSGRFQADVRIKCSQCGTPMRFIGLPCGLDLNGAATNPDATEARLAIGPKGQVIPFVEGAPMGFSVRKEG
jgi:hypothetical protein